MINIQAKKIHPTLEEISDIIRNSTFLEFCKEIETKYHAKAQIDFSKCSLSPGLNIKYKKGGRSLCTIYPHEMYFTVLIVIGKKEKEQIENQLSHLSSTIPHIYHSTQEGNNQHWLMIDIEDKNDVYRDLFKLIDIRLSINNAPLTRK